MFKHAAAPVFGPIARTKLDLMGIRFIVDPAPAAGGAATPPAATPPAATPPATPDDSAPWTAENFDPARAFQLLTNVRGDLAAQKTKHEADLAAAVTNTQKSTLAEFARLLGGGEQEETDPVKLAAKVTDLSSQIATKDTDLSTAQAAVKAGQLSTAVAVLAHGLGGSAKLLLANADFKTSIASVDPTDEAAITAKITAAIQANAALKTTPSSSGSSEHAGGQTQALETQLAAAEKAGDVMQSITLKRRIAAAKTS